MTEVQNIQLSRNIEIQKSDAILLKRNWRLFFGGVFNIFLLLIYPWIVNIFSIFQGFFLSVNSNSENELSLKGGLMSGFIVIFYFFFLIASLFIAFSRKRNKLNQKTLFIMIMPSILTLCAYFVILHYFPMLSHDMFKEQFGLLRTIFIGLI